MTDLMIAGVSCVAGILLYRQTGICSYWAKYDAWNASVFCRNSGIQAVLFIAAMFVQVLSGFLVMMALGIDDIFGWFVVIAVAVAIWFIGSGMGLRSAMREHQRYKDRN